MARLFIICRSEFDISDGEDIQQFTIKDPGDAMYIYAS
jgi:hypothetical protein